MRYLGNNFTGEYRDVKLTAEILRYKNIPEELIQDAIRVLQTGCPNHFSASTTRANAVKYLQKGKGATINRKLDQVMKTMNKEDKNNFVIPLPSWIAPFIPHTFFTPQHILEKPGRKDRQIFDGSKCHDSKSVPVNKMTSTPFGSDRDCKFGRV